MAPPLTNNMNNMGMNNMNSMNNMGNNMNNMAMNNMNSMNNMGNNMNNMGMNNMDENIFNSDSINNHFVFSLDKLSIYYKEKNIQGNKIPNFKLIYNKRYESLLGNEFRNNNNSMSMTNSMGNNNMNKIFELNQKGEFKVKCLEIYEIKI